MMLSGNTPYVAARAKARRQALMDKARLRQLINQSPDQLTNAVAESGYQNEINLYASKYTGGDLVEAALAHNLENELSKILSYCNGRVRKIVEIYTGRYEYQNAKAVLRAVANDIDSEKLGKDILPDLNEINTPWIKILESADDLPSAALQMRRKSFGSALTSLPENASLAQYEDALDRHYFSYAMTSLSHNSNDARYLRNVLSTEIDHRNILNVMEASAFGIEGNDLLDELLSGGRLLPKRALSSVANGGKDAMMDLLRSNSRFDIAGFETALETAEKERSLDAVVTWLHAREYQQMQRMSYLHPVSALPIVHYVAMKVKEVTDLRMIVRGRLAGLPPELLEAHVL